MQLIDNYNKKYDNFDEMINLDNKNLKKLENELNKSKIKVIDLLEEKKNLNSNIIFKEKIDLINNDILFLQNKKIEIQKSIDKLNENLSIKNNEEISLIEFSENITNLK